MRTLSWRQAKLDQLYEIGYNDPGVSPMYREMARAEIGRRQRKRHPKIQIKIKPKYK